VQCVRAGVYRRIPARQALGVSRTRQGAVQRGDVGVCRGKPAVAPRIGCLAPPSQQSPCRGLLPQAHSMFGNRCISIVAPIDLLIRLAYSDLDHLFALRPLGNWMPSFQPAELWRAQPHTLAKIELVGRYIERWVAIVARGFPGKSMLIIDGFAGPGVYADGQIGSPIAILKGASKSLAVALRSKEWRAREIYVELIERDADAFQSLVEQTDNVQVPPQIHLTCRRGAFSSELANITAAYPWAFAHGSPLFAFVDPFGPKGVPFTTVRTILASGTSELFLNLDADGIARIESYKVQGNLKLLNDIFGDDEWIQEIDQSANFRTRCQQFARAYRSRLFRIPGVKYSFAFEMQQSSGLSEYFLVFATKHQRGIEKMKEEMRRLGQAGTFTFRDALSGQQALFRDDSAVIWAPKLRAEFVGRAEVSWQEVVDFTLNETPFVSPKAMLNLLDKASLLTVHSLNPQRRVGKFPDGTIRSILFK
jgi:three-Cys-motif partner protein